MLNEILYLAPTFTCAFWALVLMVDSHHSTRARKMLLVFMIVATLHFLGQAIYCYHDYDLTARYDPIYTLCTALVFPLYYLYLRTLTDPVRLKFRSLWVLLPSFTIFAIYLILYNMMSYEELIAFTRQRLYWEAGSYEFSIIGRLQSINVTMLGVVFNIQIVFVLWFGAKHVQRYYKQLSDFYSNPEDYLIAPVRRLLYAFLITGVASVIFNSIGREFFTQNSIWLLITASVGFVTMLFSVGFVGFRQYFTIDDLVKDTITSDLITKEVEDLPSMNESRLRELTERIENVMIQEKLYLNPKLQIADLISKLNSNRAYISKAINQNMGISFSEMVNRYRVEYAKQLLANNKDSKLSLWEVIEGSGFSNESSFFRAFKSFTGTTPNKWLSQSTN